MDMFSSKFVMKDLGPLYYFLGIFVTRSSSVLFLMRKKYAQEIIDCANMIACKPSLTLVAINGRKILKYARHNIQASKIAEISSLAS